MSRTLTTLSAALLCLGLLSCDEKSGGGDEGTVSLKNELDSASYSIGADFGRTLKQQMVDINPEVLARGLRDATGGKTLALTDQQMQAVLMAYSQKIQAKQAQAQGGQPGGQQGADPGASMAAAENEMKGQQFLEQNKTKEGVKTTPSGLQYQVIKEGTGPTPKPTDQVSVHYTGTLLDGTVFDSSVERGQPATFALNQVIPGWTEGLQLMKVGSKYKLFIPAALAYGASGSGDKIGPNSTLIFDVELLGINGQ